MIKYEISDELYQKMMMVFIQNNSYLASKSEWARCICDYTGCSNIVLSDEQPSVLYFNNEKELNWFLLNNG